MKAGTLVRLPDGRQGRVVYHHLDGYGIKFDCPPLTESDIEALNRMEGEEHWAPDAMLRKPYPGTELECVGDEYEVVV